MCKSIKKKIISYQALIVFCLITFMVWPCSAAVIFEDNFDSQPDWNTNGQYEGAECSVGACSSNSYPTNWNFYRSVPGASNAGFDPMAQIRRAPGNLPDHTTGSGKAYVVYNENSIQGNTPYPGDGIIGKYFGSSANHMDLYFQYWIRTQAGFRMEPTAQIKMFRLGHWRGTSNIFQWSSESSPMYYLDLARVNSTYGGGTGYSSAYRCFPDYYCAGNAIPSDDGVITALGSGDPSQVWGDGNWHRIGIHAKMNTVGSSNGAFEFSYDGRVIKSFTNVEWKKSDTSAGWNFIALGGNSNNLFTSTQGADQWYAIDDVVVSTLPIPTDYVIGGGVTAPADTTAPTVSISSPTNNATVSGTVSVTANASDNIGVTKIEYYVSGALAATDTTTPYVYSWNTSALAAGTYALMTKAYDAAGNVGQSATVSVSVVNDTTIPTVSLTSPASNSTISGTVAITANAADNVGVSRVEYYSNGVLLTASNVSPYSYNWNTTSVANGGYALTAKVYDAAGNMGQSAAISITVNNATADTTAPTVAITSPAANAAVSGTAVMAASAADNVGVSKVEFYVNGALKATSTAAPFAYSWDSKSVVNGSCSLTTKAYDAAGNVGQSSAVAVTVNNVAADTTVPVTSITSPAANAAVSGTVSIGAVAADNVLVNKVEFYVNGALKASVAAAPYSYSWDSKSVVNGSCSLTTKAYDAAGNVGQSSAVTVTVNNAAGDTTAPTVAITAPAPSSTVRGTINISATANDNVGVTKVVLFVNGVLSSINTTSNPYYYAWNTSGLADGSYTLTTKAYDAAGNIGQSSAVTVTVNNAAVDATAPSTTITSPAAAAIVSGTVGIAAAASDSVGVSKVEFYVNGALKATSTTAPYSFNWDSKAVVNGSYTLTTKAYDAAGNVGQSSAVAVTVNNTTADTTAPSISIVSPLANATVRRTVNITAAASDNVGVSRVEYYINGILKATDTATPYAYSWNTKSVVNGTYTITTKAYDAAGNVKQSAAVNVTVRNYYW